MGWGEQAIQAICDRAAAYSRRDLPGFMAQYARVYKITSVTGRSADYLPIQADIAQEFAVKDRTGSCHCSAGAVTLAGGPARVALAWHWEKIVGLVL